MEVDNDTDTFVWIGNSLKLCLQTSDDKLIYNDVVMLSIKLS